MKIFKRTGLVAVASTLLLGVITTSVQANGIDYLVVAKGNSLPKGFEAAVRKAGGEVVNAVPEIGVAGVRSLDPYFAEAIGSLRGVQGIYLDFEFEIPEVPNDDRIQTHDPIPYAGGTDLDPLLWGLSDVRAPEAWANGVSGQGARVAVLDAGIDHDHPDLVPNLNAGLSASFQPCPFAIPDARCPGDLYEDWMIQPGFYFNHGTHTAGTIAAANDGNGVTGVAPDAEIVAVKVCTEYANSCSGSAILNGIVYAANIDADVINMSLGGLRVKGNDWWMPFCRSLGFPQNVCGQLASSFVTGQADYIQGAILVFKRAFQYANSNGTTIVVSAGNSAMDLDHNVDIMSGFADFPGTIGVSALGPVYWCNDNVAPTDTLAYYSNYGRSAIDVSAPGGNYAGAVFGIPGAFDSCTVAGVTRPQFAFDGVMSTISGGWGWAQGTSMSAPHVAGIAALIVSEMGSMPPSQLEREIKSRAVDLGEVGTDPIHGKGRASSGY